MADSRHPFKDIFLTFKLSVRSDNLVPIHGLGNEHERSGLNLAVAVSKVLKFAVAYPHTIPESADQHVLKNAMHNFVAVKINLHLIIPKSDCKKIFFLALPYKIPSDSICTVLVKPLNKHQCWCLGHFVL